MFLETVSPFVAEIYFNFFFKQCKIQIGAKYGGYGVTVPHVKLEEDIFSERTNSFPDGGKTLYIGNQEMSDKSRNEL